MTDKDLDFGRDIIDRLEENGYHLSVGLGNFIILKVAESFETGKEQGIKEGIKQTCREMEMKIVSIRSKAV